MVVLMQLAAAGHALGPDLKGAGVEEDAELLVDEGVLDMAGFVELTIPDPVNQMPRPENAQQLYSLQPGTGSCCSILCCSSQNDDIFEQQFRVKSGTTGQA